MTADLECMAADLETYLAQVIGSSALGQAFGTPRCEEVLGRCFEFHCQDKSSLERTEASLYGTIVGISVANDFLALTPSTPTIWGMPIADIGFQGGRWFVRVKGAWPFSILFGHRIFNGTFQFLS